MSSAGVFFSVGPKSLRVPVSLFAENRARLCAEVQRRLLESGEASSPGIALFQGGASSPRHDTDHEDLFRQESFFAWAFGVREPGFFGAINLESGEATLFCPRLPSEYGVWMGAVEAPPSFASRYGVHRCLFVDELPSFFAGAPLIRLLVGTNSDSGKTSVPASFPGLESLPCDTGSTLHDACCALRSVKTPAEIAVLRYAAKVSSEAHVSVMRLAQPGTCEYELEASFLHHVYAFGGCRHVSYTCICAAGPHASVLHYGALSFFYYFFFLTFFFSSGHAGAPNDGVLSAGQLVLLDMGAEYCCYGADITRTFPCGGTFSPDASMVYNAVLSAQDYVFAAIRPGVEWSSCHRIAEAALLRGLTSGGLLRGTAEAQAAARLGAVFMPHGLGHLLGIDTHDVGGYPNGTPRIEEPGIRSLRMNRPLLAGMVLTVEPGCYFIGQLLDGVLNDPTQSALIDWDALEARGFYTRPRGGAAAGMVGGFGGVRLEDDIVVTATGFENLTACPRTVAEVEAVMAGGAWPPAAPRAP